MKIRDILRKKGTHVVTIGPEATVHEAIETLVDHNIGALIVTGDNGTPVGIITERDILRESASNTEHLQRTQVREVMTAELIIGLPGDDVQYVMAVMTRNRIRHLPILDDDGLHGIISIGDVVNAHLREAEFENRMLRDYIAGRRT